MSDAREASVPTERSDHHVLRNLAPDREVSCVRKPIGIRNGRGNVAGYRAAVVERLSRERFTYAVLPGDGCR